MSKLHEVVKTETQAFNNTIEAWNRPLQKLGELIEIFAEYKNYLGAFTQENYNDIAANNGKETRQKFLTEIEKDYIQKFGELPAKIFLRNVDEIYQQLEKAIQEFKECFVFIPGKPILNFSDVKITAAKPALKKDAILRRFEYSLETENQVAIFDLLQTAMKAYNEANTRLLTIARPSDVPLLHDRYGLFYEDRSGNLEINFGNLNRIN